MSRTLQFKRYGTPQLEGIRGANGEIIIDNTTHTVTVHDGVTYGGYRLATEAYADAHGGGGGTTLPTNASGVLTNNGTGTLSWSTVPVTDRIVNGNFNVRMQTDGSIVIPQGNTTNVGQGQIYSENESSFINLDVQFNSDILGGVRLGTGSATPVDIQTGSGTQSPQIWRFNPAGNLTVPGGGAIWTVGAGTIGITANIANPYDSYLGLSAGNPVLYGTSNIQLGANTQQWNFGAGGNLIFPDNTVQTTAYLGPTVIDPYVWAVQATSSIKSSLTQAVAYDNQGNSFALMWQGPWSGGGEIRSSIVKLNNTGATVWAVDLSDNNAINPWSLCCDADNNVYVIVQRYVTGPNVYNNVVMKLHGTDGSILWQVDIQDTQNSNNMQAVPFTVSGQLDGVLVAGTAYNGNDSDFFISFINKDGTANSSTYTFGDVYDQEAYSVAVNNTTGEILMVGVNKQTGTDTHYYLEMIKLVLGSGAVWQKKVSVTGDSVYDVKATDCCLLADGNWAILATHDQNSAGGVITMKVSNADGSVLWSREVSQGCTNISSSMTTGANGQIYVSASTYNNRINNDNVQLVSKVIAAYDTSGNSLWQKFFEAPGSNLLIDNNWWNNTGSTGKVLALHDTHLLIGASLIPMTPYPSNQLGVVAQITYSGDNQFIGPFALNTSYLSDASVALTVVDSTFAVTTSTQTLTLGSTVGVIGGTLTYTLFHSGILPNQLAQSGKTLTLQSNGTLVNETGRNITGELDQSTDNGNNFSNLPIAIKNLSGYKRLVGLTNSAQTWLSLNNVATQLGINPTWIMGMTIDYQAQSSNFSGGNNGSMVGQIIIASNENSAMMVTHTESAITSSNSSSDVVFANLNLWQENGGTLEAIRTDTNTQQLDIIWTARVFINASEAYC
jgi:hypothetical protein